MKREYKFSSVLLIQVLTGIVLFLIGILLNKIFENQPGEVSLVRGIITSLLISVIPIFAGFIIARGLIYNRMGSVGEYFDGINNFNGKVFLVGFLIYVLPSLVSSFLSYNYSESVVSSISMGGGFPKSIIGSSLLVFLILMVYEILTTFKFFVLADNPDLSFGQLFKKVFRVGKDLWKKTIKIILLWVLLPFVIFVIVGFLAVSAFSGPDSFAGLRILLIIMIIYAIVMVFISISIWVRLSDAYLDYKESKAISGKIQSEVDREIE